MQELLRNFGVDWRLLLAQAVNFFVLLAVLWRFAYRPILEMLGRRRGAIAKGLADATASGERLARAERVVEERLAVAHREALDIVGKAEVLAGARREEILADAEQKGMGVLTAYRRAAGEERAKAEEQLYAGAEGLMREGIARVLGRMSPKERDADLVREALAALKTTRL